MPRVLILGATSAIAQEVASVYAARGARLYLVARDAEHLARVVAKLDDAVVDSHAYDFIEFERSPEVIEAAIAALGGLDVALIAHGLLGDQLLSEQEFSEARRLIDVNFTAAVAQLIPLANHFEAQGSGHLAVLSSVAGERGRPRNYTYGAAKGALTLYMQGLRSRLWPHVQVHTIRLGPVHTPMTVGHPHNALFSEPQPVAQRIVARIDAGAQQPFVPFFWRPIMWTVRNLPESIFQRFDFLSGR